MEENQKGNFLKVYANLPLEERSQIIVFINNEPISWIMAQREILEDTELGKKILKKLADLEII